MLRRATFAGESAKHQGVTTCAWTCSVKFVFTETEGNAANLLQQMCRTTCSSAAEGSGSTREASCRRKRLSLTRVISSALRGLIVVEGGRVETDPSAERRGQDVLTDRAGGRIEDESSILPERD